MTSLHGAEYGHFGTDGGAVAAVRHIALRLFRTIRHELAARQAAHELDCRDDAFLRDIGLERRQIDRAVRGRPAG